MPRRSFIKALLFWMAAGFVLLSTQGGARATPNQAAKWILRWSDEFTGPAGAHVNPANWLYDTGTGYGCAGCPANWGTGEVETMSSSTANVALDGAGHLAITPIRDVSGNWTSGRIETQADFAAPVGGELAVEVSLQQPNVTGAEAAGYWPAAWMLGAAFRGNYLNWPGIGEIDVMEDVNGLSSEFATLHCGTYPGGPCNEPSGISSGQRACATCQTTFHTYRMEYDRSTSPEQIRWYLDGVNFFTVKASQVDAITWANATQHGFFIILSLAMGGGFPEAFGGGPTAATASGVPLLVDYVRVYTATGGTVDTPGIYRPSATRFYLRNSLSTGPADEVVSLPGATSSSIPLAGTWNGNGLDAVGYFNPSTAIFSLGSAVGNGSPTIAYTIPFGSPGDLPVVGDWMGQGRDGIGVFRPATGTFFLRNSLSAGPPDYIISFGASGDLPVVGDWSGQGYDTIGVYRSSTALFLLTNTQCSYCAASASYVIAFGSPGDTPFTGDWTRSGHTGLGVFRPSSGVIYLKNDATTTGYADFNLVYGIANDKPFAGHWV